VIVVRRMEHGGKDGKDIIVGVLLFVFSKKKIYRWSS
jgi:hypothetical protein